MLLKIVYLLIRRILRLAVLISRRDLVKDAELPVLRHENAVLRRHVGQVHLVHPVDRLWLGALVQLIPRRRSATADRTSPAPLRRVPGHRRQDPAHRRQAPRMNAICERLAGTLRREFLDTSPGGYSAFGTSWACASSITCLRIASLTFIAPESGINAMPRCSCAVETPVSG